MRNTLRFLLAISLDLAVCIGSARAQFKNGSQAAELNLPRISRHGDTTHQHHQHQLQPSPRQQPRSLGQDRALRKSLARRRKRWRSHQET